MEEKFIDAQQIYEMIGKRIGLGRIRFYLREKQIPSQFKGKKLVAKEKDVKNFFRNYYISNNRHQLAN